MDNPLEEVLGQEVQEEDPPVETPEVPAEPVAKEPGSSPGGQVPISAMLGEREKRQGLERQLAELKAAQPAEPASPDEAFQAALYQQNLRVSRKFAEREHGAETIAAVHDWAVKRCDADPYFNAQMRSSEDPYGAAYQAFNREEIASKVTPERLAAFEAWEQAQAQVQAGSPVPPQQPDAPTPPRSLAQAPGTGLAGKAATEIAEGAAFDALFS
ncbi:MAG TPA: hypothetical protein VGH15_09610 [Caulobacteraceae bacterium]|jgi:hypothetical protein